MVKAGYEFAEEYLYWKNPGLSLRLVKDLFKLPLPIIISMYWLPLRYLIVMGIWIAAA
jgi:hypothetical protein